MFGQHVPELIVRGSSVNSVDRLTVPHQYKTGHAGDTKAGRQVRATVDVNLFHWVAGLDKSFHCRLH
jgi:hypothetical protein